MGHRGFRFVCAALMIIGLLAGAAARADVSPASGDTAWPRITIGVAERVAPPATVGQRTMTVDFVGVGVPPEGDSPADAAFTPDGSKIVVAHRDSQNLVVFDAASRTVLNVFPVTGSPNALAITPNGQYAVTANIFEDTASIIDLGTGVERVLTVGDQPGSVRITPDGALAVIGNTVESTLSVVDIATWTELRRLPNAQFWLQTSFGGWAIAYKFTDPRITPDSQTLIFPSYSGNAILFFNLQTGAVVSLPCTAKPSCVDISRNGQVAVVTHDSPSTLITVLNVSGQSITGTINTTGPATTIPPVALDPNGTKAAVGVQNSVRIIRLGTGAVSGTLVQYTVCALGLYTSADGQYCMCGNYAGSLISYATETVVGSFVNTTVPDTLAVSPATPRAAFIHILRKEMIDMMDINGAGGHLEGTVPTGSIPEGDKARNVVVTSDADRAVVLNNHSWNATIINLPTRAIEHVAPVGERPGAVAITPDNTRAVVANLDAAFTTVIDLATGTATNISMATRGSQVAISPDGHHAYVPVVASGDGVYRINLNTLTLEGAKLLTGNMGGIGLGLDNSSGMTLSHNGATLITCGSFDNNISIIDPNAWVERLRLAVGTFPVSAVFSPDDTKVYVANKSSNNVSVVNNAGAGSTVVATIPVGQAPWAMAMLPDGSKLYVGNFTSKSISVIALPANTVIATIPLPPTGGAGEPLGLRVSGNGRKLIAICNGADVHRINTATDTIVETVNLNAVPADLALSDAANTALVPSPFGGDGLFVIALGKRGDMNCDGVVNSLDIEAFVLALLDPAQYASQYANCDILNGDVDCDANVNLLDIGPFVECLLTGCPICP